MPTLPLIPITAGRFVFAADGPRKWTTTDPNTGKVYELSVQPYEGDDGSGDSALENDWGVWDVSFNDWAHVETGYATRIQALKAFEERIASTDRFAAALDRSSPKLWR